MWLARFSWRMVAVLCASLGIGTVAYLLHGVTGTAEALSLRHDIGDRLAASLPEAGASLAQAQDRARRRAGLDGQPRHSWTILECGLVPRSDGWRAGSHDQRCAVRGVEAFPRTDARDGSTGCGRLRAAPGRGGAAVHVVRVSSGGGRRGCPAWLGHPRTVEPGSRVLEGSVPRSLGRRSGWRVVSVRVEAFEAEVGCSPWAPVVCRPPFREPVLP